MESSVKEAELKYLQAQIDPHFLFNTLNAGAQLAMMEGADKTYNYIHKVADFFRTKIKKDGYLSTIYEELNIVDDYIYILNGRYSGEIIYTANVEEGLGSLSIPSMIFHPIVENSIKHGLAEVEWEKHIDISVYEDDDNVVVSIRDNGVGMPDEIINKILAGESVQKNGRPNGEGIGMDNVIERLRNFYNTENVMEITSVGPNMGVEVALFIPKTNKEIN
jgi:sensor histidine kinase YesM